MAERTPDTESGEQSVWASPLGRWLRGLVLDTSSDLSSLSEVMAPIRQELEAHAALGVLFVRLRQRGRLSELFSWREIDEVYRAASRVTLGSLGSGLRRLDLPTDVGLHGEGFAVVLSGPREGAGLSLEKVDVVAERLSAAIRQHLDDSLVPRVHERLEVSVGAAMLTRPVGAHTLDEAMVAALVEADAAARKKQLEHERELAARLGEALADEGVTPLFRPVVELDDGGIVGWEVGLRGPSFLNLRLEDVLLDVARRGGLEHRVLDSYHVDLLAHEGLADRDGGFLLVRAGASELLESAVRVNSLLYQRRAAQLTAADIVFLVDAAEAFDHFPSSLSAFRSTADLGFGIALDLRPDCPLALDHIREFDPEYLRLSGRGVQGIHRRQDEFDLLLLVARFGARHGIRLLASDCDDRNEVLVLQRAGVALASGRFFAPAGARPVRPDVQLP